MLINTIFLRAAFLAAGVWCVVDVAEAASPVEIEGVDRATRRELRALLDDRERPKTLLAAERLAEEAADAVRDWLRSEGYYAGAADPIATRDPIAASVRVTLGPRYQFTAPTLAFADAPNEPAQTAAQRALGAIAPGAPGRAAAVLAAEAEAVAAVKGAGYPNARALPRRAVVDHAARTLSVAFNLEAGEETRLGALVLLPPDPVRPNVVARLQTWERGDLYDPEIITDTRRNFASPGVFATAGAALSETPNPDGTRDVVVRVTPDRPRTVTLGGAYSTLEGVGVDASYAIRNRMKRMETTTVTARLAEFEQRLAAEVRFPHALGPQRARVIALDLSQENLQPFERRGVRLSTSVEAARRRGFALSYGLSLAADVFDARSGEQNAVTAAAFGEARRDTVFNPLDPRSGGLSILRLEPGYAVGDANVGFLRATAETRRYYSAGTDDRYTFAGRAEAGWVAALTGSEEDLPLDRRFYAGGGGSVRGYDFNAIFPDRRRDLAQPPGGQGLLELSLETRARLFGKWGAAAFVDGGSSFDEIANAGDFKWGAGVGLRYDLGFAPLRVDLAVPLNRRDGDEPFAIYVSLGQAF